MRTHRLRHKAVSCPDGSVACVRPADLEEPPGVFQLPRCCCFGAVVQLNWFINLFWVHSYLWRYRDSLRKRWAVFFSIIRFCILEPTYSVVGCDQDFLVNVRSLPVLAHTRIRVNIEVPDRTIHDFLAYKSDDRRILCSFKTSIRKFLGS